MMKKYVITIAIYVIIFLLALIAAYFSVLAADTVWNTLARTVDRVVPHPSPTRSRIAPVVLISYILLPIFFAIGAAFFITLASLTLLRRFLIIELNRLLVRLGVATAYAALSPVVLLIGVLALGVYECIPFPFPVPYPGAVVEERWRDLGGQGYNTITYEYTVGVPLNEIEEHYIAEMENHCVEGWEFVDTEIACTDFSRCRTSECEVSRPFVRLAKGAQFFAVYLRVVSETETNVLYFEKTRDPL
jgi:hypothetical protein